MKARRDPSSNIHLEAAKRLHSIARVLENGKAEVTEYECAKLDGTLRLEITWAKKKKRRDWE